MRVGKRSEGRLKGIDNSSHLRSSLLPMSSRMLNNSAFFRRVTPSSTVHSCVTNEFKTDDKIWLNDSLHTNEVIYGFCDVTFTWMSFPVILETDLAEGRIWSNRTRASIALDDWVLATESESEPLSWKVSLDAKTCLVLTFVSKVLVLILFALRMKSSVAWLGDPGDMTNGNWWLKEL